MRGVARKTMGEGRHKPGDEISRFVNGGKSSTSHLPCVVGQHYVTTRSVQLTQNRKGATEATQRASRQRIKLAEASQEGEKGRGK